jgi:hypothetical protein
MRREALNRQLGRWREEGVVALEEGAILIRDLEALKRISETAE